jgi:hypothetical protein
MLNNEWIFLNVDLIIKGLHVTVNQAELIKKNYTDFTRDKINLEVFLFHIIYIRFPNEVYENKNRIEMKINLPKTNEKSTKKGVLTRFRDCNRYEGIRQLYQHMKSEFYD